MLSFGIPAQSDPAFISELARLVEGLGFSRLWVNDTPMADGLADAVAAVEATRSLDVGVGVVAMDRRTPKEIVAMLGPHAASGRVVLGVGAGFSERPREVVTGAVAELRRTAPDLRLAVAAMGPRMCALGGEIADTVLLNWMTPERIRWARERIHDGVARRSDGEQPLVAAYVRVAVGPSSQETLAQEAARYAAMPHYARHFAAMGVAAPGVAVDGDPRRHLDDYLAVCDEVVARALVDARDDLFVMARSLMP